MIDLFAENVSDQDLFDGIVAGMFRQGRRSMNQNGDCAYRGVGGLKCAVGLAITDEEADRVARCEMHNENTISVEGMYDRNILPIRFRPHRPLLGRLQLAHDTTDDDRSQRDDGADYSFVSSLKTIAQDFKLEWRPEFYGAEPEEWE